MGEEAILAILYKLSVFFGHNIVAGAIHVIQGAEAKKAVDILACTVAWIIFAIFVGKKLLRIIHLSSSEIRAPVHEGFSNIF